MIQNNYLKKKKYLYQFGDALSNYYFVFPKTSYNISINSGLKTNYETTDNIDGAIKLNGSDKFRKMQYTYNVDFIIDGNNYFDIDYIKQVFWEGGKRIAFFYDIDTQGYLQYYFTYLTVTNAFVEEIKDSQEFGQNIEKVKIELTADTPFLYLCKEESLNYFNKDFYQAQPRLQDNIIKEGAFNLNNGTTTLGGGSSFYSTPMTSVGIEDRFELFHNRENGDLGLFYTDKFIAQSNYTIANTNLLVSQTLANNSPLTIFTTTVLKSSSATNNKYIIDIGTLATNNTLVILNNTNSSGIKFTWLSVSNSTSIVYNSNNNRCYTNAGVLLPSTSIKIERQLNKWLEFNPQKTLNGVITSSPDSVTLQKNTSTNCSVNIEALSTYH
jgi:hypothetical protein